MNCFRCKKDLGHADETNADYVISEDAKVQGQQKTAVVCPKCYKPTDIVLWGVHKKKSQEKEKKHGK